MPPGSHDRIVTHAPYISPNGPYASCAERPRQVCALFDPRCRHNDERSPLLYFISLVLSHLQNAALGERC